MPDPHPEIRAILREELAAAVERLDRTIAAALLTLEQRVDRLERARQADLDARVADALRRAGGQQ